MKKCIKICYKSLVINSDELITSPIVAWLDGPKCYSKPVNKNDKISIQVKWEPCLDVSVESKAELELKKIKASRSYRYALKAGRLLRKLKLVK